jgi:hypothetical protein
VAADTAASLAKRFVLAGDATESTKKSPFVQSV